MMLSIILKRSQSFTNYSLQTAVFKEFVLQNRIIKQFLKKFVRNKNMRYITNTQFYILLYKHIYIV